MGKTTLVAILLLINSISFATPITDVINEVESEWAKIYYSHNSSLQRRAYPQLIERINTQIEAYPESPELKIWKAILKSTNAEFENPFSALESIKIAKGILETIIKKQPQALDGAAFVVLGTLYYMAPSWPISFGDESKAEKLLLKGLEYNPNSIDANYFYADYLFSINELNKAAKYFRKAIEKPIRLTQEYADTQLKIEAVTALNNTNNRGIIKGKDNSGLNFQALIQPW
jgi:tetratricopeptide (TPR) repeat protein